MLSCHLVIHRSSASTNSFPIYGHQDNRHAHAKTDEPTRDEHVLDSVSLHPRRDGEGDADAEGVADECYCGEGVASYLSSAALASA